MSSEVLLIVFEAEETGVPAIVVYLATKIKPMKPVFVYCTCKNAEEAIEIGQKVVEAELAACANVLPGMRSIYKWKGELQQDEECVLILKRHLALVEALTNMVVAAHSYETPAVVALPIVDGSPAYIEWMAGEMRV